MNNLRYFVAENKRKIIATGVLALVLLSVAGFMFATKKTVVFAKGGEETQLVVFGFATASDALAQAGISLGPYDTLSVPLNGYISDNDRIEIYADALAVAIAPAVLPEVSDAAVTSSVSGAAVSETQKKTPQTPQADTVVIAGTAYEYVRVVDAVATAYSPETCYPYDGTTTASGTTPKAYHTIAASRDLPFGTKVYIPYFDDAPNNGIFVVEDRGGAITGDKIDVFYDTTQEAIQFGRRTIKIYILK